MTQKGQCYTFVVSRHENGLIAFLQLDAYQSVDNYCEPFSSVGNHCYLTLCRQLFALCLRMANTKNLAVLRDDGANDSNPTTDPTTNMPTSSSPLV